METVLINPPADTLNTLGDLVKRLGNVPLDRIRLKPSPGFATESDVLEIENRENRLCELIDGVLVEKARGFRESLLACALIEFMRAFVKPQNPGLVAGSDGMIRISGQVRIPDVSFVSWSRLKDSRVPNESIPDLAPDLAVEVLSTSNTAAEMDRKRRDYFSAGVRLVWMIDPESRTVDVFTAVDQSIQLDQDSILDGGQVLSGFALPLRQLFAELDAHPM